MEVARIMGFLKTYRRPFACARIILVYGIFIFVATHTTVFDYGITKGKLNALVAIAVMLYRFFAISFVPGLLVLWLFERKNTVNERKKI